MDGQDYLNQISASVRPEKKSKLSFLNSKVSKLVLGAVALFILIAVVGGILGGGKGGAKDQAVSLKLSIDSALKVIEKFQPSVKSSVLRSSSASLYSVLSNTTRDLTTYVTSVYKYTPKDDDKKFANAIALERDGLESALFEAKINGILDQVYANKMAYTISLIYSKETNLNKVAGENLKKILDPSISSLETLYNEFDNFQK